jgi:hypothetical protein
MYEEHFQEEEIIEFEIDGAKFGYKPTTAGEENEWLSEYMVPDGRGSLKQDMTLLNKCKVRNLKKVPYSQEVIKKISGFDKDWDLMTRDERWILISKLKPAMFSKIILEMNKIDLGTDQEISQKKD